MTSARRRVAFFADFFFAGDFFFADGFFFAASFFGAAFLTVFFLAEGALLAADFFRVGFFLLTVFFLRAGFFLAIGKSTKYFLSLRSNPPSIRFRNGIPLPSMQRGSARERPRHLPFLAPQETRRLTCSPRSPPAASARARPAPGSFRCRPCGWSR